MQNREPLFNFSEPVPAFFAGFLIIIAIADFIAPQMIEGLKSLSYLAAVNGDIFVERGAGVTTPWPSLALHTFFHLGFFHIFINSLMICIFGVMVCRAAGSGRNGAIIFFILFFATAIAGGLLQWGYWIALSATGAALGASSGASGLFAAAGWVVGGRDLMYRWGLGWLVINIAMALFNMLGLSSGFAWPAHLGGYLAGMVLAPLLLRPRSTGSGFTR